MLEYTLGLGEGTDLRCSDGSFYGSNYVTLEGSWLKYSLESYDVNALGSSDGSEDGIFDGSTWES